MEAELIVDCQNPLGEGLFYDSDSSKLWWVNIPSPSKIYCLDLDSGQHQSWEMGEMVSYAVPRRSGGMIVASHGGLNHFDPDTGGFERLKQLEPMKPFNRSNDACCDGKGRLWVGTMQNNVAPDRSEIAIVGATGSLFRVDADLSVTEMESDIAISNSCCFDEQRGRMYFCDTPENVVWSYSYDSDSGEVSNRTDFGLFDRGLPDGSTVDSEGGVWNARYGGSCVVRFAPDGSVDQVVDVPASQVTCCTFGGPDLDTLYITTAREGLDEQQLQSEPHAGGLFACKPGPTGVADVKFAG